MNQNRGLIMTIAEKIERLAQVSKERIESGIPDRAVGYAAAFHALIYFDADARDKHTDQAIVRLTSLLNLNPIRSDFIARRAKACQLAIDANRDYVKGELSATHTAGILLDWHRELFDEVLIILRTLSPDAYEAISVAARAKIVRNSDSNWGDA